VRVPVPDGCRAEAESVVEELKRRPESAASPHPPVPWKVRVAANQADKVPRRTFYDLLRRHRVPHPQAGSSADVFHTNGTCEVIVRDAVTASRIVADLQELGITAEVLEPPAP